MGSSLILISPYSGLRSLRSFFSRSRDLSRLSLNEMGKRYKTLKFYFIEYTKQPIMRTVYHVSVHDPAISIAFVSFLFHDPADCLLQIYKFIFSFFNFKRDTCGCEILSI